MPPLHFERRRDSWRQVEADRDFGLQGRVAIPFEGRDLVDVIQKTVSFQKPLCNKVGGSIVTEKFLFE